MSKDVVRGTLLGTVGQAWHLITAFLLYAFLARRFGPSLFGEWRLVLTVLAWFEIFVTAGLVKVATKEISERRAESAGIRRAAYVGQTLLSLAVFAAVEAVAGIIAGVLRDPAIGQLIRIAALDIPLFGLFMVASSEVLGEQRFERQAVAVIVYATAKAALITVLVAVGFSVPGALVGNAVSSLVGFAVVAVRGPRSRESMKEVMLGAQGLLLAAVPFLVLSLLDNLGQNADLWLVSAVVANTTLLGLYASAAVIAEVPVFLFLGLNRVVFPAVAKARAEGDLSLAGQHAALGVRAATIMTVLGVGLIAGTSRQVLEFVFSTPYEAAALPLMLLMVAASGRAIRATCTEILMAEDRRRDALLNLAATVALEVVAVAVLAGRYGLPGAAAGAAGSALLAAGWSGFLLRDTLGMLPLVTATRSLISAAVVGVLLTLLSPKASVIPLVLPLASAVYVVILRLMGELTSTDIASIRAAIAGGWRG